MNPQTNPSTLDPEAAHQRVKAGLKAHRVKLGVLTTAAFVLGFLAMTASLVAVWCYPVFILPKQREMQREAGILMDHFRTNAVAPALRDEAGVQMGRLLGVQIQVANVTTAGSAMVAAAVGLLGLGTLALLTVVILNRRVALNQVNASLTEISRQLREFPKAGGGGP